MFYICIVLLLKGIKQVQKTKKNNSCLFYFNFLFHTNNKHENNKHENNNKLVYNSAVTASITY